MTRWTPEEYQNWLKRNATSTSKYKNIKTEYNGFVYDSAKEAKRAQELDFLLRAKKISNLQRQVKYPLMVNGVKIGFYKADFVYEQDGKVIIEDVKGLITSIFKLKRKILDANGITIKIT